MGDQRGESRRVSLRRAGVLVLGLTTALAFLGGLGLIGWEAGSAIPGEVAADDPNLFYSPWTWLCDGAGCQTTHDGASLRFGWTGRNLALGVDVSMHDRARSSLVDYPVLGCSIDGGPVRVVRLEPGAVSVPLARGLADGRHRCVVYLRWIGFNRERWWSGRQVVLWRVTGLRLDPAGATFPDPALRPRRALFYGDSILSGAYNFGGETDARQSWAEVVAASLDAEPGRVSFEAQSYAVAGHPSNGNVPGLFLPGAPEASTWDKLDSRHSRLVRGEFAPRPDYVFLAHGANDALERVPAARVEGSVRGLLPRIRRGAGPEAEVFVVVPFEGYHRAAITTAFDAYQAATPDRRCHLIDLGPAASIRDDDLVDGQPVRRSFDGVHPTAAMHARLGAMMAERVREVLSESAAGR